MITRKPSMLVALTEPFRDEMVEEPDELAMLVLERLANAGYLTAERVKDCSLYVVSVAA
jgi:hypothetical protein